MPLQWMCILERRLTSTFLLAYGNTRIFGLLAHYELERAVDGSRAGWKIRRHLDLVHRVLEEGVCARRAKSAWSHAVCLKYESLSPRLLTVTKDVGLATNWES